MAGSRNAHKEDFSFIGARRRQRYGKNYVKFRGTGLRQAREIMEQNIPHVAEYVAAHAPSKSL